MNFNLLKILWVCRLKQGVTSTSAFEWKQTKSLFSFIELDVWIRSFSAAFSSVTSLFFFICYNKWVECLIVITQVLLTSTFDVSSENLSTLNWSFSEFWQISQHASLLRRLVGSLKQTNMLSVFVHVKI